MFAFSPQARSPVRLSLYDARAVELTEDNRLQNLCLGPIEIPFVAFEKIPKYIETGYAWNIEPQLEKWTERGNNIISLKLENDVLLAEVQYVASTNQIFPPH